MKKMLFILIILAAMAGAGAYWLREKQPEQY